MKTDYMVETVDLEGLLIEVEKLPESNIDVNTDRKKRLGAMCVAIREKSGMKRPEFAQWFGIPYRTYQDWELGKSAVPEYMLRLMAYKVKMESYLKEGKIMYADDKCTGEKS